MIFLKRKSIFLDNLELHRNSKNNDNYDVCSIIYLIQFNETYFILSHIINRVYCQLIKEYIQNKGNCNIKSIKQQKYN